MVSETFLEGSPLAEPLRDLRGRVEAMLTPRARAWCADLRQRVAVNPPPLVRARDDIEAAVDQSVRERRRARISYWSPTSGTSERVIEPLLLWHAVGGLYVVAWDDRSGEVRMFAVHRISAIALCDEHFEPDPGFDPVAFLRGAFGVMAGPSRRVVVDFEPRVAHLFRERAWHASQQVEERPGGGVRVRWTVAGLPEVARWLAGFGGDGVVVEPAALREAVWEIHRGGLDRQGQEGV